MGAILILGAYGLLGTTLSAELTGAGFSVVRQSRRPEAQLRLDPLDAEALASAFRATQASAVVNLIAATNVDRCQKDCAAAFIANVRIIEELGRAVVAAPPAKRPHVVQISTDQVYLGHGPHEESNALPGNVYALSKYAGEQAAERFGATILRTNFFGRSKCSGRTSFTDWIVGSLRAGKSIPVFEDVRISALHMRTLCTAVIRVLERPTPGIFNLGSADGASKADIAFRLARLLDLDTRLLRRASVAEADLVAPRPTDMTMDVSRFAAAFDFPPPTLESQILLAAKEYANA